MSVEEYCAGKTRIRLLQGDLTEMAIDAIVNAANSSLMGGGGVDGAVHRRGGPKILEELRCLRQTTYPGGLPTGKAVITSGGNLKAKKVIHTVGPVWRGGNQEEQRLLADAYVNSLQLAVSNGLRNVAFPSISTGAYGYPIEKASRVALESVKSFLKSNKGPDEVAFVLFSAADFAVYKRAAAEIFG